MQAAGLAGVSRRTFVTTTRRDLAARPAPDLVQRTFTTDGPDRLWVADITYTATWAGFLFLAVVLDVWSRRVVGWAMAAHLRTELVLDALNMEARDPFAADVDPVGGQLGMDAGWPIRPPGSIIWFSPINLVVSRVPSRVQTDEAHHGSARRS